MTVDPDALARFALTVWQYKQGEVVSLMVHLGDRLGLYRTLDGVGWTDAAGLAAATGLDERWLREWLRGQAAAGLLDTEVGSDGQPERFRMTEEGSMVLARESDSPVFAAGAFSGGAASPDVVDALAKAFRTGRGLTWDQLGPAAAHMTERMLAPWVRQFLVPVVLPALADVVATLEAGASVLDVGCGAGVALRTLAEAFPHSRFTGVDPSRLAIARAEEAVTQAGLTNVTFSAVGGEEIAPQPSYDLVMTFDCLHDMTDPPAVAAAIRRATKPGGTWLIREIRSAGDWSQDRRNPVLALHYGMSVVSCMSSALSAPGGAGLGTLGLPPSKVEALCLGAGFSSVTMHDFDDPANLYYQVRP